MTSEGLGEMFEGDFADTLAGKFPLVLMGGRAEGVACADPVARTPIGASGNSLMFPSLQKMDLRKCPISDEAVRKCLQAFSDKEPDHVSRIEKLDLIGDSFSQSALEDFDEINRRMAKNIIVFKAFDV